MGKDGKMASSHQVVIDLTGYCGTDWPLINIKLNDQLLWSDRVDEHQALTFDVPLNQQNYLSIEHTEKNNDTICDHDGNIIRDRYCQLNFIKIDQLLFDIDFFSTYHYAYACNDGETLITNYFGKDGIFSFNFEWPAWRFWGALHQI